MCGENGIDCLKPNEKECLVVVLHYREHSRKVGITNRFCHETDEKSYG